MRLDQHQKKIFKLIDQQKIDSVMKIIPEIKMKDFFNNEGKTF